MRSSLPASVPKRKPFWAAVLLGVLLLVPAAWAARKVRDLIAVGTDARADLAVEAHLISPWGTWEWIGPAAFGRELPAGGTVELGFDVTPPPWVEPGEWWALIRVGCAGRLVYSPAVKVTVR